MSSKTSTKKSAFLTLSEQLISGLLWVIVAIIGLHIFWQLIVGPNPPPNTVLTDIAWRFGVDFELSVPTWVSSVLALLFAAGALLVAVHQKDKLKKNTWYLLAILGLFISLDELSALHELVLQALHIAAGFGAEQSLLKNAWLLLLPFLALAAAWFTPRLRKGLPSSTFNNFLVAFSVYGLGALIVEYISSPFDETTIFYRIVLVVLEEALEMIGLLLMLRTTLQHIDQHERALADKLAALFRR